MSETPKDKVSLSDEQAQAVVKKKRGGKIASVELHNTASNEEMKQYIGSVLYWRKRTPVKTDEECAERLDEFFQHIYETGELPTVEKMCLALGVDRRTVYSWEMGTRQGPARQQMIKQAKQILAALDAELVQHNKIPQVTYIFRAKNFYDMRDQTDVVVAPQNPLGDQKTPEQLQEYLDVIDAD